MATFLIDANLPYLFSIWNNEDFIHVFDVDDSMPDKAIWEYARANNLTIVTKDTDFSNKILFTESPPKVIHLKIGNMRLYQLHDFLTRNWVEINQVSKNHKLTNVYIDRIEGIN